MNVFNVIDKIVLRMKLICKNKESLSNRALFVCIIIHSSIS